MLKKPKSKPKAISKALKAKRKKLKAEERVLKAIFKEESKLLNQYLNDNSLSMWDEIDEYLEEYRKVREKEIVKQQFDKDLKEILYGKDD